MYNSRKAVYAVLLGDWFKGLQLGLMVIVSVAKRSTIGGN